MKLKPIPIGSEYYFEPTFLFKRKRNLFGFWLNYFKNYKLFFSGRDALRFLLKNLPEKNFYLLPSYTCYEVIRPFEELKLNFDFYRVNFSPKPEIDFDDILKKVRNKKNPVVIIIEYFGFPVDYPLEIPFILDVSHSLLTLNERNFKIKPLYIFGSLRKLLPLTDGGILFHEEYMKNEIEKENLKALFIKLSASLIRYFHNFAPEATEFLYSFAYNTLDRKFERELIKDRNFKKISAITNYLIKRIPYDFIIKKRRENFIFLLDNLKHEKITPLFNELPEYVTPLNFPFFTDEKKIIKETLVKERIFPPTLWSYIPPIIEKERYPEIYQIPKKLLSLPCDHRYNLRHMEKIIKVLENA